MSKTRKIFILPKQWVYPFVSAFRVFERTLNPAFVFKLRCSACPGEGTDIDFVMSVKNPKAIIGLECKKCLQTVKFESPIDPDDDDFPARLLTKPTTALSSNGEPISGDQLDVDGYLELMFGDE